MQHTHNNMELRAFLVLLQKNMIAIILISVITGALALLMSLRLQPTYHAVLSVYVQKIPEQPAGGDFTFDGFYAQQAAESYTDTVVGLFESPAIHVRALQFADQDTEPSTVEQVKQQTRIRKVAPRLIDLEVRSYEQEEARVLAKSLFKAVSNRLDELTSEDSANLKMKINAVNDEPLISLAEPRVVLYTIIGVLVGMFGATTTFLLKEYLLSARQ